MISETLGNIYTKLEDKFYSFFDFLEEKGIPVYKLIDPIEEKGIPFFPLTIAVIAVLIVSIIGFGVVGTSFDAKVYLNLKDTYGEALQGVHITVTDATGEDVFAGIKNHRDEIELKANAGAELTFSAEKEGYEPATAAIKVINTTSEVNLSLKKFADTIKATFRFYDKETGTSIEDVYVSITWKDIELDGLTDEDGEIEFLDVPVEEDLLVTAIADSYYEYTNVMRFESEETKSIELTPEELAFEGESTLIITFFDKETGELLKNVKVKVYNAETDELIDEKIVEDGVYLQIFPKGTVVRYTAEKDGYKLSESREITLRGEEEDQGAVDLEKGGKELEVTVLYADTQNPVVGAKVTLYNSENKIIVSEFTLYEGIVLFKGLEEDANYWIGAEKEGYLPAIKQSEKEKDTLELVKESTANSRLLLIQVIDAQEQPAENVALFFTQMIDSIEIPTGLGVKYTGSDGKFGMNMAIGAEIFVKATKELLEGRESIVIGEHENNNLLIKLSRKNSVKSIKFFDETGQQITEGNLVIKTKNGEIIYDGELEGEILFDAGENNSVEIELTTADGKKYTEEINLEGENDLEVRFDSKKRSEKVPEIEFLGVFDLAGNETEGITKGKEYILKFKTEWSEGLEKGGLHFRTGSDSIKYSDSEDIGITGFDGGTTKFFYGRSYSSTPAPGNKIIDFSNRGEGGKLNKFVEMYYTDPEGTKIIKIRIKARELISQETVKLKYRVWSVSDGKYLRNPTDDILGEEKESSDRQSLYAETSEIKISVFDSESECLEEVCIEYTLIGENGEKYDKKDFYALEGKVYALEMQLHARKSTQANFKLNTSAENPKIGFTGKEIDSFSQFIDNNSSNTSIEFTESVPREGKKIRVYFKAKAEGDSFINSRITTPKDSMQESFHFKIYTEKELFFTSPETVKEGKDFEITVEDEEGKGIENAKIVFYNTRGKIETTVFSDNAEQPNGKNGVYRIENNMQAGEYLIEVSAPRFVEKEKTITVLFGKGLELQEEITINLAEGETFVSERIRIKNLTEQAIENLAAEIVPAGNFPKEFELIVNAPAALNAGEENEIELMVEYTGNEKIFLHGESEIKLTGEIKGIAITAKTRVKVNYNQKLDPNCLEFDRKELKEYLIGASGNSKQMDLGLKNNCEVALEFEMQAVPRGQADDQIEFSTGRMRIEKDEVKNIKIGVVNKIQRNFVQQAELEYDLFFKSSQLEKSIPATIILWHETFSLSISPSIVMWLTQSKMQEQAIARHPLYIRNTGMADIENLSFSMQFDTPGNTDVKILWGNSPQKDITVLKRGMTLIPPIVVEATTNTKENQKIIGRLVATGVIEGRQYTLRTVNVFINVSAGWSCLEAWGDDLLFSHTNSEIGTIDKKLYVINKCTESVILGDKAITPGKIGGNNIFITSPNRTLNPGEKAEFVLRLSKKAETNQKAKIQVTGVGRNTSKIISSMPIDIELAIGKGSGLCGSETEPCKGENETTLEYCDESGYATFYFPKQSSNCSEGYCDAEELGKFLTEKFQEEIRKAKLRIADVKTVENLGNKCNLVQGYCTFGALGIFSSSFDFFLKNDVLTEEMLKSEMEKLGAKELVNTYIGFGETTEDLYSRAGDAFGQPLVLVPEIRGCGKYSAKIIGAVPTAGNELRANSVSLLLEIKEGREPTPECENVIQNFVNFIPVDESYSPSNSNGSWLGTILKEDDLEEIQKNFSKTLFKDKEGKRVTFRMQNNFIRFNVGNFDQSKGIVKVAMQRTGTSDEPKQIEVYITDDYIGGAEEVRRDIALEAGTIISNLKHGSVEEGCIGKNMDYVILGNVSDIIKKSGLQWKDETNLINLYPETQTCVDLKLQSKIEAPEAVVSWSLVNENLQGIYPEETVFKNSDGKEITNKGERNLHLGRQKWKEEGKLYSLEFRLCFSASKTPRDAAGSKLKLEVAGIKERELTFGQCAIDPVTFLERSRDKKAEGIWFATVNWAGLPEKLNFRAIEQYYYDKKPEENPMNKRQDELGTRKTWGLVGYGLGALGGCAAVATTTGGMLWLDCLANTLIPVGIAAFSDEDSVYHTAKEGTLNGLKSIGIDLGEVEKLKKDTGIESDSEFFWSLNKTARITTGAVPTAEFLLRPTGAEAKTAATEAAELKKIGTTQLETQVTDLADDFRIYNETRVKIQNTGIQKVYIGQNGKMAIEGVDSVTGVAFKVVQDDTVYNTAGEFLRRKSALADTIQELKVGDVPINAEAKIDEIVRAKGSVKPEMIAQDIATQGEGSLAHRAQVLEETLKGKAASTPKGKEMLEAVDNYAKKARAELSAGHDITTNITSDQMKNAIKAKKAISAENKLVAWAKRNPRKARLFRGLGGGLGAMVGGALGWMAANAIQGDYEQIDIPEVKTGPEEGAEYFEKGQTYKVVIKKNAKTGEFNYRYSKVPSGELGSIPEDKRLDSDACDKELVPLGEDMLKKLREIEEELFKEEEKNIETKEDSSGGEEIGEGTEPEEEKGLLNNIWDNTGGRILGGEEAG